MCVDGPLRFASYYGDHMVLQKSPERAVLWGYGPEGAQVTLFMTGPINHKTSAVTVTKGKYSKMFPDGKRCPDICRVLNGDRGQSG